MGAARPALEARPWSEGRARVVQQGTMVAQWLLHIAATHLPGTRLLAGHGSPHALLRLEAV